MAREAFPEPERKQAINSFRVVSNPQNLKLYRHPKILRYVNGCSVPRESCDYLFTEKASPLAIVLAQQTPLQIVLGLHDIIQALEFLHDRARVCHNNVCQGSIFVTPQGRWKLAGLEFAKKYE